MGEILKPDVMNDPQWRRIICRLICRKADESVKAGGDDARPRRFRRRVGHPGEVNWGAEDTVEVMRDLDPQDCGHLFGSEK